MIVIPTDLPDLPEFRRCFPDGKLVFVRRAHTTYDMWTIGAIVSHADERLAGIGRHRNLWKAADKAVKDALAWHGEGRPDTLVTLEEQRRRECQDVGHEVVERRGQDAGRRVLQALRGSRTPFPGWLGSYHLGSPDELARGIDVVVCTDKGDFWLHVTDDASSARPFLALEPARPLLTLVTNEQEHLREICKTVVRMVDRARYLQSRHRL